MILADIIVIGLGAAAIWITKKLRDIIRKEKGGGMKKPLLLVACLDARQRLAVASGSGQSSFPVVGTVGVSVMEHRIGFRVSQRLLKDMFTT